MIATLALTALLAQQEQVLIRDIAIPNPDILVQVRETRLDPPKLSPKLFGDQRWEFDWLTSGYGKTGDSPEQALRVRVYSQERKDTGDKAPMVARMAMQLWDRTYRRLRIDTPQQVNGGIADFYLSFGGSPGGEQLFGEEILPGQSQPTKVNTIYIYQLDTFKDPVEMAREVAHEYGHAILPAIGGFKQPEVWANGYLGEKLFLEWIAKDMTAGRLTPEDAMGANLTGIKAWLAKNVDPLIHATATEYPDGSSINEAKGGMDAFLGDVLYVEALCPASLLDRALAYTQDAQRMQTELKPPTSFPQNVVLAASEMENLTLSVPQSLFDSKKPIWIPLGKGSCNGATVMSRKNGWAQVLPLMRNIVIKNPPIG